MTQLPVSVQEVLTPASAMAPLLSDKYERHVSELIRPADEVEDSLVGILGIQYDTTTMVRRGSRFGPAAVREALATCLCYEPNIGVDLSEARTVADFGDVDVFQTRVEETWERVTDVVEALTGNGPPLVIIGGDHGLTFPIIEGVARSLSGRIGVIVVDAHYDVRISHHGETSSGVPFRYLLERLSDSIDGKNVVELGVGGWHNTRGYGKWLDEQGVRVITAREIHRGNLDELVAEAFERASAGTEGVWLSFDIDSVDGAFAPATNIPAIAGLTSFQALEIVWAVARHPNVLGMDVMEVSPPWDHSGITEHLAAGLVLNFIAGRHTLEA